MQRDCLVAGRGRLTSFSVEYKTDSIVQPIAAMPLSRQKKPTFAKPHIKVLSRHGIEDCSTVRMPKRKRLFFDCALETTHKRAP
ncbi:hypothetical protein TNCV_3376341 [Trichonephila clavipes]|nr:hypothetical protein TNCV_3376341 [Trichonephila clavipes]